MSSGKRGDEISMSDQWVTLTLQKAVHCCCAPPSCNYRLWGKVVVNSIDQPSSMRHNASRRMLSRMSSRDRRLFVRTKLTHVFWSPCIASDSTILSFSLRGLLVCYDHIARAGHVWHASRWLLLDIDAYLRQLDNCSRKSTLTGVLESDQIFI